ncbi:basic helix-loop-helix protein [Mortierella sp. AD011]|nr:basic helix-loop-helix protein [Mortierella sp. AD010]KAF9403769.1 basic helix-loop-helix protein [Mortierella sp. AD011]
MASNQDVQEVLNTLTNSLTGGVATAADNKAFAESFSAAIAQHSAEAEAAAIAAASAAVVAASNVSGDSAHSHEQLQRIAEQHQQEVEQREKQEHHRTDKSQEESTVSQDEQNQQVLQHIATATAEASTLATVPITPVPAPPPPAKPVSGTEEWHKMRRDNHKEVERRRRETINEGINDLSKVVPNCDKNKGSILRQAVKYIQEILAQNERLASEAESLAASRLEIDKYILEKSVAEATYQTLSVQHEQLKRDYEELRQKMGELEPHVAKKQRVE